jgi:hypothetical protein
MIYEIQKSEYQRAADGSVASARRLPNHQCLWRASMAANPIHSERAIAQPKTREIWKPVPSEPGVMASSLGRILLQPAYAPMTNGGYRSYLPKPGFGQVSRATKNAKRGFLIVMVRRKEKPSGQAPRKVHQLVCEAFHGPKPFPSAVVIHIDENAINNRPENLKWGTQKENLNAPGFIAYCRARTGDAHPSAKAWKKAQQPTVTKAG